MRSALCRADQCQHGWQIGRLTNLKQLTVDTSWWTRYRSKTNPDLGATFPNAVPSLATGMHTAIPRSSGELGDPDNPGDHVRKRSRSWRFRLRQSTRRHQSFAHDGAECERSGSSAGHLGISRRSGHFRTTSGIETAGNATRVSIMIQSIIPTSPLSVTGQDSRKHAGQPDHAGTLRLHQQEPAEVLHHSADHAEVCSATVATNGFVASGNISQSPAFPHAGPGLARTPTSASADQLNLSVVKP